MMIALKSSRHLTHFSLFSTDSARIFKGNQFLVLIEFNMQTFLLATLSGEINMTHNFSILRKS